MPWRACPWLGLLLLCLTSLHVPCPSLSLLQFGSGFLSKFECAQCDNRLLEEITLVDTPGVLPPPLLAAAALPPLQRHANMPQHATAPLPSFLASHCPATLRTPAHRPRQHLHPLTATAGVLSGEKQRVERAYDFIQVCSWFAARCDLILLLFDPAKLDISDEFKAVRHSAVHLACAVQPGCGCSCDVGEGATAVRPRNSKARPGCPAAQVISTLRGHDDKVRVVLNKADSVDQQQLMRVYGALMWSLGKVFKAPEVCRVYIGR